MRSCDSVWSPAPHILKYQPPPLSPGRGLAWHSLPAASGNKRSGYPTDRQHLLSGYSLSPVNHHVQKLPAIELARLLYEKQYPKPTQNYQYNVHTERLVQVGLQIREWRPVP